MRTSRSLHGRLEILIVEDDAVLGPALLQRLRLEGHEPRLVTTGADALSFVASRRPDAILSDIRLPDMSGEALWSHVVSRRGLLPTWFMTAYGEVDQAVRLVKAGARDYLTKPVDIDALVDAVEATVGQAAAGGRSAPPSLGRSPAMIALTADLAKAAPSSLPLLLQGETGVGKEVAARFVHERSPRAKRPFVALNCAAIPRDLAESTVFGHERGAFTGAVARHVGVAEEAADGTLFLDEIAELSLELQSKLLRLIEARSFRPIGAKKDVPLNARVVCATHADLATRISAGAFRDDLFFRLNVITLHVPPLRARRDDILDLAESFVAQATGQDTRRTRSFSSEARDTLLAHGWPGNVRELRNRVERAVVMADGPEILPRDLFPEKFLEIPPDADSDDETLDDAAREAIRRRVRKALEETGGNQTEAARRLGVSRTTIWKYSR